MKSFPFKVLNSPRPHSYLFSALVTMLVAWIALRLGERVIVKLGATGIRVMTRIMGLLLAAIAVQFVITGARNALHGALHS